MPKRPTNREIQSRKTLFKMLNNEFAYRYWIVPRETGLLVAFSLFQTPLNISGDVSLREHPVFSALILVSPTKRNRRKRSDDRKHVCGSQAIETSDKNFLFLVVFVFVVVVTVFVFSRSLFLFASLMESLEKAGFFLEQLFSLSVSLYMLKV